MIAEVKKIALGLRYDGANYHGWQRQEHLSTVQSRVEEALSSVADHPVSIICAGRTDAGVHATAQVVHFTSDAHRNEDSWKFGANSNLPPDISVTWAKIVDPDFHARFSATSRRYRYVVFNHDVRPGILRNAVGWYYKPLDEQLMQQGANYLLGEHDFKAYRGAGCQAKSSIREIQIFKITRQRKMIIIEVQANAFLLHMVRNIVGVLVEIGTGERSPLWAKEVLESCDRRQGGVTISPNGLYLVEVGYPLRYDLPRTPIGPFFLP